MSKILKLFIATAGLLGLGAFFWPPQQAGAETNSSTKSSKETFQAKKGRLKTLMESRIAAAKARYKSTQPQSRQSEKKAAFASAVAPKKLELARENAMKKYRTVHRKVPEYPKLSVREKPQQDLEKPAQTLERPQQTLEKSQQSRPSEQTKKPEVDIYGY